MLELNVPEMSLFNETTETFCKREAKVLKLEHSLLSISKWESKYEKPFLKTMETGITNEEFNYYIVCMDTENTLTEDYVNKLMASDKQVIQDYMSSQHTATTISGKENHKGKSETITSELIYYWMIAMEIPFDAEKWYIHRLLTLIRVCGIKNNPKKMSKRDTMINNTSLNAARRKALGTKG